MWELGMQRRGRGGSWACRGGEEDAEEGERMQRRGRGGVDLDEGLDARREDGERGAVMRQGSEGGGGEE